MQIYQKRKPFLPRASPDAMHALEVDYQNLAEQVRDHGQRLQVLEDHTNAPADVHRAVINQIDRKDKERKCQNLN
jgi:hypothetical protein